ncbi:unnamed protein product [Amoebophrya sp. A120]|nr:unnamed protein product [Amoebophrya sp. A120]|eukprot:GSA120T00003259001.1
MAPRGRTPAKSMKKFNPLTMYPPKSYAATVRIFCGKYAYRAACVCIWGTHFPLALYLLYGVFVSKDLNPLPDLLEGCLMLGIAVATLSAHIMNTMRAGKHVACLTGMVYHFITASACTSFRLKRADQFTYCRAIDARIINSLGMYDYLQGDGGLIALFKMFTCVMLAVSMYNAGGPGMQKFLNNSI